jgi:hypothetical protein
MTSFQVKVLQKKFTLLHAHFSKIVLKYSNEVHLLRYLTPLQVVLFRYSCMYIPMNPKLSSILYMHKIAVVLVRMFIFFIMYKSNAAYYQRVKKRP